MEERGDIVVGIAAQLRHQLLLIRVDSRPFAVPYSERRKSSCNANDLMRCYAMPAPRKLHVVAAFVALCVIWSSTWLAIKIGLRDLPPISFVAFRFIIAAGVVVRILDGRFRFFPPRLADYSFLAFTGILPFAINYGLLFWGEQHVSSGLAAILQATIPM